MGHTSFLDCHKKVTLTLGAWNNKNLFYYNSGDLKFETKVLAGPYSLGKLQGKDFPHLFQLPLEAFLGLWLPHPGLYLHGYICFLCLSSLLFLIRILVIWYKTCWIIQDDLISRSLITSAKIFFLNKITFIDPQHYSIDILLAAWWGGGGFPGGTGGKEPICQCRRRKSHRFSSWVRKSPWRRAWQPPPVFLLGVSPWTEEPGGLKSMGLHRVGHDWSDLARVHAYFWGGGGTPDGTRQPYFPLASPEHGWLKQEEVPEPNRCGLSRAAHDLQPELGQAATLCPQFEQKSSQKRSWKLGGQKPERYRVLPKALALWPWGQAKRKE